VAGKNGEDYTAVFAPGCPKIWICQSTIFELAELGGGRVNDGGSIVNRTR
jgi:hypothetical protein